MTAPASSVTARVWKAVIEESAPFLRALAPEDKRCAALLLDRRGAMLDGEGSLPSIARRVLVKAGLPQTITSRSVRKATVVCAQDAGLSKDDKEAMAVRLPAAPARLARARRARRAATRREKRRT